MNESLLRWEGRIGSLKGLAIIALILNSVILAVLYERERLKQLYGG